MEDTSSNSNIEWKNKKGFGVTEKLTRKTDVKKSLKHEAKEKKAVATTSVPRPADLPKGLKKIRKKIKEVYDDEEEEEYYEISPLDLNNSLMNALYEDEKRTLQQKNTLNVQKMQQTVGNMEAVLVADKMIKESGLKGLANKTVATNVHDVTLLDNSVEKILSDEMKNRKISSTKRLSKSETVTMLRGIDRIRKMAVAADESQTKALQNLKIEEVITAGEKATDDRDVAELILKKSGRKSKKNIDAVVKKSKEQKETKKQTIKPKEDKRRNLSAKDIFRD